MIELDVQKTVKVQAKELHIHCKVCDDTASLHDQDGVEICNQQDGYVPGFMPGQHYGDYVILNIEHRDGSSHKLEEARREGYYRVD